tara:strand:- start:1246 stop:1422 length:177 start_codon:yes stop_codon:yes gene_type:complete
MTNAERITVLTSIIEALDEYPHPTDPDELWKFLRYREAQIVERDNLAQLPPDGDYPHV